MSPQEAINWIRLDIEMAKFDPTTGEEAYLNDDAKNVIMAQEIAIKCLEESEPIFHLQCLRCKKPVGSYSEQTMEQVSYTHYSYCEDCLRKGLKMLKKQDALDKQGISAEQADHIADSDKKVDQFREATKKIPDGLDTNVGSIRFKPGDKFILELGQERKMFGEFEIAGTDLYVETSLLEKLKRYEPEEKPEVKSEIICDPDCDGFVCSQNGIYGWCPKMERWGCEYFYELERRNDG